MKNSAFAKNLIKVCKSAKNVAISGHINPDYDALGSCLSLQKILEQNNIRADIILEKPLENFFEYLDKNYNFVIQPNKKYDVLITVDTAELKLIPENVLDIRENAKVTFNIDHHQSNKNYAKFNYVEGETSSACEALFYLFKKYFVLDEELASLFYIGIYADTGGFVYSNTKAKTFNCLAELISTGINADALLLQFFRGKTLIEFEMTRRAFNSVQFYFDNKIAVSVLRYKDFQENNASLNDGKFIISYLQTIKGVQVAICVSEPQQNDFHVSLRTASDNVNVSEIAESFGGGGHIKASGLTLKGDFDKALNALIRYVTHYLKGLNK